MGFDKEPLGAEKKTYAINHLGMKLFSNLASQGTENRSKTLCMTL
jgi:hypothetical protein